MTRFEPMEVDKSGNSRQSNGTNRQRYYHEAIKNIEEDEQINEVSDRKDQNDTSDAYTDEQEFRSDSQSQDF